MELGWILGDSVASAHVAEAQFSNASVRKHTALNNATVGIFGI